MHLPLIIDFPAYLVDVADTTAMSWWWQCIALATCHDVFMDNTKHALAFNCWWFSCKACSCSWHHDTILVMMMSVVIAEEPTDVKVQCAKGLLFFKETKQKSDSN